MSGHSNQAQGKARTALRQVRRTQQVLFPKKSTPPHRSLTQVALRRSRLLVSAGSAPSVSPRVRRIAPLSLFAAFRAPSLSVHCTILSFGAVHPSSLSVHCTILLSRCIAPSLLFGALHLSLCSSGALHPALFGALHLPLSRLWCITPRSASGASAPLFCPVPCTSRCIRCTAPLFDPFGALHHRRLCDALRLLLCPLLGTRSNGCPFLVVFFPPSVLG